MKHVFKHQIDQIVTYLSWGVEWVDDSDGEHPSYDTGGAEALGHLLSCWLVQIAGMDDCETAVGRDILFKEKNGKWIARRPDKVTKAIVELLWSVEVEVVNG